jgi:hypothetical protein
MQGPAVSGKLWDQATDSKSKTVTTGADNTSGTHRPGQRNAAVVVGAPAVVAPAPGVVIGAPLARTYFMYGGRRCYWARPGVRACV